MRTILAILLVSLFVGGCASTGTRSLPAVPAWREPATARTYSALDVRMECARLAPQATVYMSDATFTPVSHEWLVEAVDWSWHFSKAIGFTYTAESGDCEKFALGFAFAANVAAMRAGVKAQPLIARIDVRQTHPFGGVGVGGTHALNALLSDRGLYVYEPQSRTLVPLAEYPNRSGIFNIRLGG